MSAWGPAVLSFSRLTLLFGLMASPVLAQETTIDADATLVTPMVIVASEGMRFGTIAVSNGGECIYEIAPDGTASKQGENRCAFLSGFPTAATFEIDCGAGALVRMELIHANLAPTGAVFSATALPMTVDGANAGSAMQILPCDGDGRTVVRAGGRLVTTPEASAGFTGRVGTIRLEVVYD